MIKEKKRTLILSDMLETGQSGKLLYRQVAELVHSRGVEKIIGVGEEIRTAAARFEIEKYFFPYYRRTVGVGFAGWAA